MSKQLSRNMRKAITASINDALDTKFTSILHDLEYRLDCLYRKSSSNLIGSRDINIAKHQLDGYTLTDNSPSNGSIKWAGCSLVYKGVTYPITDGNTAQKYIFWKLTQTDKTKFSTSDTKPILTNDDVLVFINNSGIASVVMGQMTSGLAILDGTVSGSEIKASTISGSNLMDSAVSSAKIASGAVTSAAIASGAVGSSALANGAVGTNQLASNAVTGAKIASGAITDTQLASNAVTSSKIATGAVTSTALASGAVTSAAIASGAVTSSAISNGAVGTNALADSSITGAKIGAGAVATDKLSTALHMIF